MAVRTPAQAIAYAKTITRGYVGLCLVFVRTCFNIGSRYPSAAAAWAAPGKRHVTSSIADVPAGAPVFFSIPPTKTFKGNPFGHVALHLGGGLFRTNYSAKGTVITARLGDPVFAGMHMLGWREDLNGVDLHLASPVKHVDAKPSGAGYAKEAGLSVAQVKELQAELNRVFPAYSSLRVDGDYGRLTAAVVSEFQHRAGGLVVDGVAGPLTRKKLAAFGVKL